MAVSDADGIVYYRFIYDTYGELSDITTDDGISLKSSEQLTEYRLAELAHVTGIDYLYNGQYGVETDQNGLYYMRARYYDQDIKRFINRDVVSGNIGNSQSLNRYCYVQGNPVSLTDPFGLCPDGNSVSEDSAIGWLLKCLDSSGSLYSTYANRFSPRLHTGLDVFGFFNDGADAINGILYFLEGNTKLGIEYTLRGLTFYGALIGGPVGAGLILLGIGFNLGFAAQGMAGAIDRAYTDYQNGTLGWHNLADLGLNGLAVAGGTYVGGKSLQRVTNGMISQRTMSDIVGKSKTFYTVQNSADAKRLLKDGLPWPTDSYRANLGDGVYAWSNKEDALNYFNIKSKRTSDLQILEFEVLQTDLNMMKKLDLTKMSDDEVNAFLECYARLNGGTPNHGYDYIQRMTGLGVENYFHKSVYKKLKFKKYAGELK
ncbi:MAG: RHS repeat-associated core domain-containing protein [Lachnospiraceae bacterium]|nr:RHS repeat-associated core domain-containing protein [Lachnospiraceae bacterium]